MRHTALLALVVIVATTAVASGATVYILTPKSVGECSLSGSGSHSYQTAVLSGSLTATTNGSRNGTLTVTAKAEGVCPIAGIIIAASQPPLPSSGSTVFTYDGNLVSWTNMVPIGGMAVGSFAVSNVTSSTTYRLTVVVVFQPPAPQGVFTLDIAAAASA